MTLVEQYKNSIAVADKWYASNNDGKHLAGQKKVTLATCLNNINRFMNESFTSGQATQAAAMGD